jgi:hypothetical protein
MAETQPSGLAAALAAVQRRLPDVRKGETAHVRSDKGSYTYRYATLPDITKALLPLLGENGLAWVTRPTIVADRFVLVYELLHTSGEKISGEYPLPANGSPQALGSAITYARRYCLCAVTGVAADDDDDGQAATVHHERQSRPARQADEAPSAGYDPNDPRVLRRRVETLFARAGIAKRDDRLKFCEVVVGRPLTSSDELRAADWPDIIAALEAAIAEAGQKSEVSSQPNG